MDIAKASENTAQEERYYVDSTGEKLSITREWAYVDSASCMKNTIGRRQIHSSSVGMQHNKALLTQELLVLIKCGKRGSTQLPLSILQKFHAPTCP